MKSVTIKLTLLLAIILFQGCKEDRLDLYDSEANIYFSLRKYGKTYELNYPIGTKTYSQTWLRLTAPIDSLAISYGYLKADEKQTDTIYVPVSLMGNLAPTNRPIGYKFGPNTTATEGTDFKIVSADIPANKELGAIAIEVYRAKYEKVKIIDFELLPNETFQTNYKEIIRSKTDTTKVSTLQFRVSISDNLSEPSRWRYYVSYLGDFSAKKLLLIRDITNIDIEEIFYSAYSPQPPEVLALGSILKKYLREQKAAGNTIYEEDGVTEMTSGRYS